MKGKGWLGRSRPLRIRAPEILKSYIRSCVEADVRPISRDMLTRKVHNYLEVWCGISWSRATVAREVRRAIGDLEREGIPIVSDGTGFRVARTPEERDAAALKLERMGIACLRRAASIKRLTLAQEARQLGLFEEEVGHAAR